MTKVTISNLRKFIYMKQLKLEKSYVVNGKTINLHTWVFCPSDLVSETAVMLLKDDTRIVNVYDVPAHIERAFLGKEIPN